MVKMSGQRIDAPSRHGELVPADRDDHVHRAMSYTGSRPAKIVAGQ